MPARVHVLANQKGGVGKTTTAVNLALALAAEGANVGILDADIYGPSLPLLTGVTERPRTVEGNRLDPIEAHGLKLMSIGFLAELFIAYHEREVKNYSISERTQP